MAECASCVHYRLSLPADPLAGIRMSGAKAFELRNKWRQELKQRALLEQERVEASEALDWEPVQYPYCVHYSTEASGGDRLTVWVLCEVQNPNEDCPEFTAAP